MSSINACFLCKFPFNSQTRMPKLLPDCGHSLCLQCLLSSLKHECPVCSEGFSHKNVQNFPNNLQLITPFLKKSASFEVKKQSNDKEKQFFHQEKQFFLQEKNFFEENQSIYEENPSFFEEKLSLESAKTSKKEILCPIHKRKLEAFCRLDKKPICLSCLLENQHRFHVVIPLKDAILEEKYKILDFLKESDILKETLEKRYFSQLQTAKQALKGSYEDSLENLRDFFNRIHAFLNEKQSEIQEKILLEFQKEENRVKSQEQNGVSLLNSLEEFRTEYNEMKKAPDLELFRWSLEKEPLFHKVKNGLQMNFQEKQQNFLKNAMKKGQKIYEEIGQIFRIEEAKLLENRGFLGKVKLKGKENWGNYKKTSDNGSRSNIKNKEMSFLIEEQRKFHLKMATLT